jgi:hypothetical protein
VAAAQPGAHLYARWAIAISVILTFIWALIAIAIGRW